MKHFEFAKSRADGRDLAAAVCDSSTHRHRLEKGADMKDNELQFDRSKGLYSKSCKKQIREKIALYYPPERCESV